MKVNAVIVTYNRLELLKMAISHLQKQTYPIFKIVIINNSSTDGTTEYLETLSDEQLDIINLSENLGGAGGFYHGIKRACELECDYLWIMDDDTIATETALQKLVDSLEILKDKDVGFLSSNVLFKDDKPCLMNIPTPVYEWNEFVKEGIVKISHTSFVAMFFSKEIVKEVGLPVKEYFIWGDDGEYSTRILLKHEGYLIGNSEVYHYMNENVGVDIFNTPKGRIGRFFYFYRNTTVTARMRGFKELLRHLILTAILILKILFSRTQYKCKKVWTVSKGVVCGLLMRVRIDQIEEKV